MRVLSSSTANQTTDSVEPSSKSELPYPVIDESSLLEAMKGAVDGPSIPSSTNSPPSPTPLAPSAYSLLQERQLTHGKFEDNAAVSQHIKAAMRLVSGNDGWYKLDPVVREALEQIALKLSRIASGQASVEDHWLDIAGYSNLVLEHLGRKK